LDNLQALPETARRVLVVDDDQDVREFTVEGLELLGFDVFGARNGQEAMLMLSTAHDIAVVVCDLRMPGLNGLDLIERVLDFHPAAPVIEFIILSGCITLEEHQRAERLGVYRVFSKPTRLRPLAEAVQKALALVEARRKRVTGVTPDVPPLTVPLVPLVHRAR